MFVQFHRYFVLGLALSLGGCIYEAAITTAPTRKVEDRLVGTWLGGKPGETVEVRKFDETHYVLFNDGKFYRAFHFDLDGVPFVSIQTIDSLTDRKYWFVRYELSANGERLTVQSVKEETVPKTLKATDELVARIRAHLGKDDLFHEEPLIYRRQKAQP